jgi:hypothetical protein
MFEGVERPCTPEELLPPQALKRLNAITIKKFFINISGYLILIKHTACGK